MSQRPLRGLLALRDTALPADGETRWEGYRHGAENVSFDRFYLVWASADEASTWTRRRCAALRSMRTYKRIRIQGGTYSFTVTLAEWHGNDLLVRHISALRAAFTRTTGQHRLMLSVSKSIDDRWIGNVLGFVPQPSLRTGIAPWMATSVGRRGQTPAFDLSPAQSCICTLLKRRRS